MSQSVYQSVSAPVSQCISHWEISFVRTYFRPFIGQSISQLISMLTIEKLNIGVKVFPGRQTGDISFLFRCHRHLRFCVCTSLSIVKTLHYIFRHKSVSQSVSQVVRSFILSYLISSDIISSLSLSHLISSCLALPHLFALHFPLLRPHIHSSALNKLSNCFHFFEINKVYFTTFY